MLKIKTDNGIYIIPERQGIHLMANNSNLANAISCLNTYFGQKKKTKGIVIDEDSDVIDCKDAEFIYVPASETVESWFDFKPKTLLNTELSNFIENNPEKFQSIDSFRNLFHDSLTDSGMYRFIRILSADIPSHVEISTVNFEVRKIVQNYCIDSENYSREQLFMFIYNLLLYINRNKYCIVYIDFPVTDDVVHWLRKKADQKCIFLVNNDCLVQPVTPAFDSMIILSPEDHLDTLQIGYEQTELLSYLVNPVVIKNLAYQTEKNRSFISKFLDKSMTFSIQFTSDYML